MKNWIITVGVVVGAVAICGRVVAMRAIGDRELADAVAATLCGGYCGNAWNTTGDVPCNGGTVYCETEQEVHYCAEVTFNVLVPGALGNLKPHPTNYNTPYCTICGHNCGLVKRVLQTVPCGT